MSAPGRGGCVCLGWLSTRGGGCERGVCLPRVVVYPGGGCPGVCLPKRGCLPGGVSA